MPDTRCILIGVKDSGEYCKMDTGIKIVELGRECKGTRLLFRYTSRYYYQACTVDGPSVAFGVVFRKMPLASPVDKEFTGSLLEDHLDKPRVFCAESATGRIGYVEVNHETWNNRVRVTNLWVEDLHRRNGVGGLLMRTARQIALGANARALILETQSCNYPAISFYLANGFSFTGCDLTAYGNDDIEKDEVRLELFMPLQA